MFIQRQQSNNIGYLRQYYRDEPVKDNNNNVYDFLANNSNNIFFKFKQQKMSKQKILAQKMFS